MWNYYDKKNSKNDIPIYLAIFLTRTGSISEVQNYVFFNNFIEE